MATKFKLRNRQLRHEWWLDNRFLPLTFEEKVLFLGLHNLADDEGRLVYAPWAIMQTVLPGAKTNPSKTLDALTEAKLLTLYAVDGQLYLEIADFNRQPLRGRRISRHPASSEGKIL